ncbi:hypothetical protein TH15_17865 [Thalassospira profundimaris]|nr:hypothetical protein TH15_17865 [Thalassospira profundimaris]
MIGIVIFEKNNQEVFRCEFPLEAEDTHFGMNWHQGIHFAVEEFRKQTNGLSLFDTNIKFSTRT